MKILKYNISKDDVYQYFVEADLIELLGETYLDYHLHQTEDNVFYLMGTEDMHNQVKEILCDEKLDILCNGVQPVIEDVTDSIYHNIMDYANLENMDNDNNLFLNLYNSLNKDDILDKILELGIEHLNVYDKQILAA